MTTRTEQGYYYLRSQLLSPAPKFRLAEADLNCRLLGDGS